MTILILNIFYFYTKYFKHVESNENNVTDIHVLTTQISQMLTFFHIGFGVLFHVLKKKNGDAATVGLPSILLFFLLGG